MAHLIDSHCHLDFPDFDADRDEMLSRARARGIGGFITINTRVRRFAAVQAIAAAHPDVFCTVGTHPHNAAEEADVSLEDILEAARDPQVVGIGEAGLDYHYDRAPRDVQEAVFRTHIEAARRTGLPLVIHSREAEEDTARILEDEMGKGAFTAVLHCFSSRPELAWRGVEIGLFVSFSGIVTFKKSDELRELAKALPEDRLLVETDAPYLAPVPNRGRRNEPGYVRDTAEVIAEVRGVALRELAEVTTRNALGLFSRMPVQAVGSVSGAVEI
ncbi:MAG: TatD family hydrolase [Rhodobiaceae bacterium]|nr:TatD family hydrolase [Rhodobiaceae bacterium]MCC0015101.1 TatD family hydrolase [Rhodobiaceae bacterium]MCC0052890.1 TatD family hydrolase [Rhodobiaceae bacterium]